MSGSVSIERTRSGDGIHLLVWKQGKHVRFCGHEGRTDRRYVLYVALEDAFTTCETCAARLAVLKKFWKERGIDGTTECEVKS